MNLGVGYEVARPTGVCALSGEAIEPGQRYIAALFEGPEQLERRDYAFGRWEEAPRSGLFGYWAATMPQPNEASTTFVSQGEIAELFDHLGGEGEVEAGEDGAEEDRRRRTFRFILALMLMRKRWLRLEGTRRDGSGREVMVLSWSPGAARETGRGEACEEKVEVVDPGMDEGSIADAIEQVGAVMGGLERGGEQA